MKKILFCAGLLALAASCSDNDYESLSKQNQNAEGISFVLDKAAETRGELEYDGTSKHQFRWWAEDDIVAVKNRNTVENVSNWGAVEYKATRSVLGDPALTAKSPSDILHFTGVVANESNQAEVNAKSANFLAYYPAATSVVSFNDADALSPAVFALPALAGQVGTGKSAADRLFMYDYTSAYATKSYESVGEAVKLSFTRPSTALVFKLNGAADIAAGIDYKEYIKIFGALETLTFEVKGAYKEGGDEIVAPSIIDYGTDATYKVVLADETKNEWKVGATATSSSISMTMDGVYADWHKNNIAYMAINPVNRAKFVEEKVKEDVEITYDFENITLVKKASTSNSWVPVNGEVFGTPELNITEYPYLVTKDEKTLIVNQGAFSGVFNKAGTAVEWNEANVAIAGFETIIINSGANALTPAEFARLKEFTSLKNFTLNTTNTSIPKDAFKGITTLKMINLPNVTSVATDAFASTVALEEVYMESFDFSASTVTTTLLKAASLVKLNMSAVKNMNPVFPAAGFSLANYTKLEEVTVNPEGVILGTGSFKGCTSLETVTGKVTLDRNSTNAFSGCGELTEINVTTGYVPANAFTNCGLLTKVILNGKDLKATEVGKEAFMNTAITKVDLSGTAVLGASAFKASALKGFEIINGKEVLKVGATMIPAEAFSGCANLKYVHFTEATSFGASILAGVATAEIKFTKPFTAIEGVNYVGVFGTTSGTNLFVSYDQTLVDGNVLTLNASTITFNNIIFE